MHWWPNRTHRSVWLHGFTVVEAAMVIGLLVLIAGATATFMRTSPDVGADLGARASLTAALDAVIEVELDGTDPSDPTRLGELIVDISFTADASTGPVEVSVAGDGDVTVLAASNGVGVCWLVRYDTGATSGQPVVFHAYDTNTSVCDALEYLLVDPMSYTSGRSWRDPATVTSSS